MRRLRRSVAAGRSPQSEERKARNKWDRVGGGGRGVANGSHARAKREGEKWLKGLKGRSLADSLKGVDR